VPTDRSRLFERIYEVIRQIPPGRVATYGQIAGIVGCTARVVGYATAATPEGGAVPWQRVINSRGEISIRPGDGASRQRALLDLEGVWFSPAGRVDFSECRWPGPGWEWLERNGFEPGAQ
jgi:methylated-DNA-protein-cysteine methyltransferase-like protein